MAAREFAVWHRWDRNLALLFVIAAWAAVLVGFYPAVSARWRGEADFPAPLILQLHVFAFAAWLCLLTAQVPLIRTSRTAWHMRLGLFGAILVPVLVVTAIGAEAYSQRFYSPQYPGNLRFFIAPLFSMLVFACAACGGVLRRRHPAAHKRLMMLATAMILVAAYNRWWGEALYEWFGDGLWGMIIRNFAGPDLLFVVLIGYDLVTRRRVHPVLAICVSAILAGEFAASAVYHSDWWPDVVRELVGI
jgi:hypothetical protein